MSVVEGGCHCGNIHYRLESERTPAEMPLRVCDCTFCSKIGARYTSDPKAKLSVEVRDGMTTHGYRFGHQTADFLMCDRCSIMPVVLSKIDGQFYAVLNVNTSDRPQDFSAEVRTMTHGAEEKETRLDRRRKFWIGDVTVTGIASIG